MAEEKPTHARKQCPACKFTHPEDVLQCSQCGLLFDKWRDPKQREAERRLASLANDSQKGLPKPLIIALIFLIGVPLLLAFVPDVSSRALGAKLRYRGSKGEKISYNNSLRITLTDAGGQTLQQFALKLKSRIEILETDSGNNNSYLINFMELQGDGFAGLSIPLTHTDLSSWGGNVLFGPRGESIALLQTTANNMQQVGNTINRMNRMRTERMEARSEGRNSPAPTEPTPQEIADAFLKGLNKRKLSAISEFFPFHFPQDRVRSGSQWEDKMDVELPTPFGDAHIRERINYRIASFSRAASGFQTEIDWDIPITADVTFTAADVITQLGGQNAFQHLAGSYKGTALIDYHGGFVRELEGQFEIPITADGRSFKLSAIQKISRY